MSKNWQDHTWNKGGIRGNYGAYRDSIWNDLSAADTDGDGILSRGEFNKISNKHYDIIGDGRAPHTGNYFDEGGGIQEALARLATRVQPPPAELLVPVAKLLGALAELLGA